MKAIDNAVAHYKSIDTKIIEVPEWGDGEQPMKIFCEPITLFDMKKFMKLAKDDEVEMLVAHSHLWVTLTGMDTTTYCYLHMDRVRMTSTPKITVACMLSSVRPAIGMKTI